MHSIFVFDARDFISLTKPTISDVEDQQYYLPYEHLREFYEWVLGYILTKQFGLPIINFNKELSPTYLNIYKGVEPLFSRHFPLVISQPELQRLDHAGEMKYLFNGSQLFIISCSQV